MTQILTLDSQGIFQIRKEEDVEITKYCCNEILFDRLMKIDVPWKAWSIHQSDSGSAMSKSIDQIGDSGVCNCNSYIE